jgi:geranylgeranyl pyrophosphate synthase
MVQTVLRERSYDAVRREDLLNAITLNGGLEEARARADEFAQAARNALEILPESQYLDALRAIPTYVLDRER